tara:strand:+ start:789 stop:1358 length:570 start_codon:yes stop_codon:yes gene_type:complete
MNLHTNHKAIIGMAAGLFLTLSLFIAVFPALEAEKTLPTPGLQALSGDALLGRELYLKEGCGVCHTQFVRDLPVDAPWGRGSIAGDYALEDPPLLGTQRTGPDLTNVGLRQSSEIWNLIHLYNPRAVVTTSIMPGYPWYFEFKSNPQPSDIIVPIPDGMKPPQQTVIARTEAIQIVRYLQSLRQIEVLE